MVMVEVVISFLSARENHRRERSFAKESKVFAGTI